MTFGTIIALIVCGWVFNWLAVEFMNWITGEGAGPNEDIMDPIVLLLGVPWIMVPGLILIGIIALLRKLGIIDT